MDSLKPNNSQSVVLFHVCLKTTEPEIMFSMIVRQFRIMLALSLNSSIDEIKRLAPWQKSKILSQATSFGNKKLTKNLKKLYEIDKNQKTGKTSLSLEKNIDIFLLEI